MEGEHPGSQQNLRRRQADLNVTAAFTRFCLEDAGFFLRRIRTSGRGCAMAAHLPGPSGTWGRGCTEGLPPAGVPRLAVPTRALGPLGRRNQCIGSMPASGPHPLGFGLMGRVGPRGSDAQHGF